MRIISKKEDILGQCSDLLSDESKISGGIPSMIAFPESVKDLCDIITSAKKDKQKITFIGGHTGTTGGSLPIDNSTAVSFSRMKKILKIKLDSCNQPILLCEPGVTLSEITEFLDNPEMWSYQVPGTELLKGKRYCYLPDPTELTAQLGGTVSTNASGARSFRFGPTRNHIHSLSMVFPSSDTFYVERGTDIAPQKGFTITTEQDNLITIDPFSFRSPDIKNAAGFYAASPMDLIDLFIGSEGTLAAFSSIGIRIYEKSTFTSGCSFFPSRKAAFSFADFLRTDKQICSIEFFDSSALAFIEQYRKHFPDIIPSFPPDSNQAILWEYIENDPDPFETRFPIWESELLRRGSSFDKTWCGIESREIERLKKFRHALPEMVNLTISKYKSLCRSIRKIGTDSALPSGVFTDIYENILKIIETEKITHTAFGHLGNYHIHINLLPSNEHELQKSIDLYDIIMNMVIHNNGTISAEHGIGKLKKKYLISMYGHDKIEQMKKIKTAFDPFWQFNPETLF